MANLSNSNDWQELIVQNDNSRSSSSSGESLADSESDSSEAITDTHPQHCPDKTEVVLSFASSSSPVSEVEQEHGYEKVPSDLIMEVENIPNDNVKQNLESNFKADSDYDDSEPDENVVNSTEIEYKLIKGGTQRGKDCVISNDGHRYVHGPDRKGKKWQQEWRCCIRSKKKICGAALFESNDGKFQRGKVEHNHPPVKEVQGHVKVDEEPLQIKFSVVIKNSRKHLVSEDGYMYVLKRKMKSTNKWRCIAIGCMSTITERKPHYFMGPLSHNHKPLYQVLITRNNVRIKEYTSNKSSVSEESGSDIEESVLSNFKEIEGLDIKEEDLYTPESKDAVSYKMVQSGSTRGHPAVISSDGFRYTGKQLTPSGKCSYRCSERPKNAPCKAILFELNGHFERGKFNHNHPALSDPNFGQTKRVSINTTHVNSLSTKFANKPDQWGNNHLIGSDGHSYHIRRSHKNVIRWLCDITKCFAEVIQRGEYYFAGKQDHNHEPKYQVLSSNETDEPQNGVIAHAFELSTQESPRGTNNSQINEDMCNSNPTIMYIKKLSNANEQLQERNLGEPNKEDLYIPDPNKPVSYALVDGGSIRGNPVVISSDGFRYTTRKSMSTGKCSYRCSERRKNSLCRATLFEVDGHFERGKYKHNHLPLDDPSYRQSKRMQKSTTVVNNIKTLSTKFALMPDDKGKNHLIGSDGHSFHMRRVHKNVIHWLCDTKKCDAEVIERGGKYFAGKHAHTHEPKYQVIDNAEEEIEDDAIAYTLEQSTFIPGEFQDATLNEALAGVGREEHFEHTQKIEATTSGQAHVIIKQEILAEHQTSPAKDAYNSLPRTILVSQSSLKAQSGAKRTDDTKMFPNTANIFTPSAESPNLKKRKFTENFMDNVTKENIHSNNATAHTCKRSFVKVPSGSCVFQTEEFKSLEDTLYLPLRNDTMLNIDKFDQVTFRQGSCFIADHNAVYCGTGEGDVIDMWRYCETIRKLYVSRTFLFTDRQAYQFVRKQLDQI